MGSRPDYNAFVVEKRGKDDSQWTKIGAAWPHGDGNGMTIYLQALPVNGEVVLRIPKNENGEGEEEGH